MTILSYNMHCIPYIQNILVFIYPILIKPNECYLLFLLGCMSILVDLKYTKKKKMTIYYGSRV